MREALDGVRFWMGVATDRSSEASWLLMFAAPVAAAVSGACGMKDGRRSLEVVGDGSQPDLKGCLG